MEHFWRSGQALENWKKKVEGHGFKDLRMEGKGLNVRKYLQKKKKNKYVLISEEMNV